MAAVKPRKKKASSPAIARFGIPARDEMKTIESSGTADARHRERPRSC